MSAPIINLPRFFKIVDATAGPVTTNGGVTSDYITLKDALYVWIVIQFKQAVGHATSIQPQVATAVAPSGATSITFTAPIWSNLDTTATDTLVSRTAATSYAVTTAAKPMQVIIGIDPSAVAAMGDTYDVIGFTVSDSSQATNFVSAQFYIETNYKQATPPTAITD